MKKADMLKSLFRLFEVSAQRYLVVSTVQDELSHVSGAMPYGHLLCEILIILANAEVAFSIQHQVMQKMQEFPWCT